MNAKQRKTYERIFEDPINGSIEWKDVENMLLSLGAEITEGSGSRVRIKLNGERAVFHRPHPERTIDKGALKAMRAFLVNAGVRKA